MDRLAWHPAKGAHAPSRRATCLPALRSMQDLCQAKARPGLLLFPRLSGRPAADAGQNLPHGGDFARQVLPGAAPRRPDLRDFQP